MKAYFPKDAKHSGVDIHWVPSAGRLDIGGWYDSMVGIETTSVSLREFFDILGIDEKACKKAFKEFPPS